MEFPFRHDRPRKFQEALMRDCYECVLEGIHFLAHAPTGIGKTDAVFSAVFAAAFPQKKVIYLSPKNSQHQIALNVVEGISKKYGFDVNLVELVGKRYFCIHPLVSKLSGEDFYEVCRRLKEREECPYYVSGISGEKIKLCGILSHTDIYGAAKECEVCPYEVALDLASESDFIVGDYYHIFSRRSGGVFLKRAGINLDECVLIIDEAHNLPDRIRKTLSFSLSTRDIERAAKEVAGFDPDLASELKNIASDIKNTFSGKPYDERELSVEDFSVDLDPELLEDIGMDYLEISGKTRSYAVKLANFIEHWGEGKDEYLRYARVWSDGETISVVKKNLDPSELSARIFEEVHSAILISGTLVPVEMYADVLGVGSYRGREYPNPFPQENRLILVDPSVTTRYSRRTSTEYARIAGKIEEIVKVVPGNTAVFFPSFEVLNAVVSLFTLNVPVFVQSEGMTPRETIELYSKFISRNHEGSVLFAVAGGSLSEGIDYPGRALLCVVVVGIPLAEMTMETKALISYYDKKFGKGWLYGYVYPAITKTVQAAGRCIRSESDVGGIVLMDERYLWKNYRRALPSDFRIVVSKNPHEQLRVFYEKRLTP